MSTHFMLGFLSVLLSVPAWPTADIRQEQGQAAEKVERVIKDRNFGSDLRSAVWMDGFGNPEKNLTVCWENISEDTVEDAELVRSSIAG